MPMKGSIPFKVVRCRFFDRDGRGIFPHCPHGSSCKFLHPFDRVSIDVDATKNGWPGHDPKPHQVLKTSSPPPSQSENLHGYRSRRSRSRSPERRSRSSYSDSHRRRDESSDMERRHSSRKTRIHSQRDSSPAREKRDDYEEGGKHHSTRDGSRSARLESTGEVPLSGSNNVNLTERGRWGGAQKATTAAPNRGSDSDINMASTTKDSEAAVGSKHTSANVTNHSSSFLDMAQPSPQNHPQNKFPLQARGSGEGLVDSLVGPSKGLVSDGVAESMKLISQLTKVHLRLLDNRKIYNDESLKLEAFESLAAQFDAPNLLIPPLLANQTSGGRSGSFASDLLSSIGSSCSISGSDGPNAVEFIKDPRKRRMLSNSTQTNEPSKLPESSVENQGQEHDRTGQQKVHQALLETLSTARQRQRKVEKRVREDFEEMAGILERIWKNTIETKGVSPTEGTNGTSIGPAKQLATVESQRSDFNPSLAQSAIKDKNITELQAGEDNVTSVDAHGKVLKKARRVSFHDEVGASEREREMLRCFEEKIVGLEKRLGRFAQVEKENIKMKAELKAQKEALEMIKSTVEVQNGIIAGIAGSQTDSPTMLLKGTDDLAPASSSGALVGSL